MRRANDPQRREKIIQATLEAVKLLRNTCCYAPQNCYPCRGTVGIDDLLFFRN